MTTDSLDGLVGRTVDRVLYYVSEHDGPSWSARRSTCHAADNAVEFRADGQTWSVTWAMQGTLHGYLVERAAPVDEARGAARRVIDVTDWPDWQVVRATPVAKIERVHEATAPPDTPANSGLRLHFRDGHIATVALGYPSDDEGGVEYRFDDLVVFLAAGPASAYLDALEHEELAVPAETLLAATRRTSPVPLSSARRRLDDLTRLVARIADTPTTTTLGDLVGFGVHLPDMVVHELLPTPAADSVDEIITEVFDRTDLTDADRIRAMARQAYAQIPGAPPQ